MKSKSEIIEHWLVYADHDLEMAKLAKDHLPMYYEMIAFHCQQSVEKYLKAYLIFLDIEPAKTHDLLYLHEILSRFITLPSDLYDKLSQLQDYSVEVRYPNEIIELSVEEIRTAVSTAGEVKALTLSALK